MNKLLNEYVSDYQKQDFKITEGFMTYAQAEWLQSWIQKNLKIRKILEIGFNGGFSSGVMLNTRADISVVSVDLGCHEYVLPCKSWIDKKFPDRHLLVIGDSRSVLPRLAHHIQEADLIFIDGGHTGDIPARDIFNCLQHCRPDAFILIDDYAPYAPDVVKAVDECLKDHKLHGILSATDKQRGWILCKKVC